MEQFGPVSVFDIKRQACAATSPLQERGLCRENRGNVFYDRSSDSELVNLSLNPTFVIMDLGCTRSMGSLRAIEAFMDVAKHYDVWFEWKRCWTHMSFANGESEWLEWCVVIHFPTNPPTCTTIDVHEKGAIPILMSLPQMCNLGFVIDMSPGQLHMSCEAMGMDNEPATMSTSRHACVDLLRLCGKKVNLPNAFITETKSGYYDSDGEEIPDLCSLEESDSVAFTGAESDDEDDADMPMCGICTNGEDPDLVALTGAESGNAAATAAAVAAQQQALGLTRLRGKQRAPPEDGARPHTDKPFVSKKKKGLHGAAEIGQGKMKPFGKPSDAIPVHDEANDVKRGKGRRVQNASRSQRKKASEPNGDQNQASAALKKIHEKLREPMELYKLHLKHYHMNPTNFRRRTSALQIPEDIYQEYERICRGCQSCQKFAPAPQRSKVSGMRANDFGDLWFLDHTDVTIGRKQYHILVIVDAMSNLLWSGAQETKLMAETMRLLNTAMDELNCQPKAVCGDSYFEDVEQFQPFLRF